MTSDVSEYQCSGTSGSNPFFFAIVSKSFLLKLTFCHDAIMKISKLRIVILHKLIFTYVYTPLAFLFRKEPQEKDPIMLYINYSHGTAELFEHPIFILIYKYKNTLI